MNKEYFLTELGIYLKVLPEDKRNDILATYQEVFQEGIAAGQEEEIIAKSLGKPKDVAGEILKKYDLPLEEKNIYKKGWEEIQPQKKEYTGPRFNKDYTTHSDEEYFQDELEDFEPPKEKSSSSLAKLVLVLFNIFVMIWVIISLFFVFLAAWIMVILLLCAPLLGIYLFLTLPLSAGVFQLAIMFILFGIGLLGLAIGRSLTSLALRANKSYWAFNRRIFKGGR